MAIPSADRDRVAAVRSRSGRAALVRATVARLGAAALAVLALAAPHSAAADDGSPQTGRAVAVLEYRADSDELDGVAEQIATLLADSTSLDVIDPDGARQRYSGNLDREVAQCAGATTCIAELGRDLDVAEVILVGVSQFGDVILTLQRIDSTSGAVAARIAEAVAPGDTLDREELLGYLRRVIPNSDFPRYGTIRIKANLRGAVVVIGEEERGETPIGPVKLSAPASYDIRLSKDGYVPFRASVFVPPGAEVEVNPVLERKGSQGAEPLYRKWWVWTIAGAVVVGTATAIALAGGSDEVSVTVAGF